MTNEAKQTLLNLIVFDEKDRFIDCLNDKERRTEMFELLDDIKPYLIQCLKDNGVFDEEETKTALQYALDYEQDALERRKDAVKKQKIVVCDLEKKIKELGVEL